MPTTGPEAGRPLLLVAACALVDGDGRVLVAERPPGKPMEGHLEFPGGKLLPGEAPEACLIRELKEELGVDTRELWPLGRVVADSGQLAGVPYLFAARVVEGGAPEREEGESIDRVYRYRFTELRRACERGEILDSFTLVAVLRLTPHFEGDRFVW